MCLVRIFILCQIPRQTGRVFTIGPARAADEDEHQRSNNKAMKKARKAGRLMLRKAWSPGIWNGSDRIAAEEGWKLCM